MNTQDFTRYIDALSRIGQGLERIARALAWIAVIAAGVAIGIGRLLWG